MLFPIRIMVGSVGKERDRKRHENGSATASEPAGGTQGDASTSLLPCSFADDPGRQRDQQASCLSPPHLSRSPRGLGGCRGQSVLT